MAYIEREAIDPVTGTTFQYSADPGSYYVQKSYSVHIGDPEKQRLTSFVVSKLGEQRRLSYSAEIQPSDLSDEELAEHLTAMRAQYAREFEAAKQQALAADAEIRAEGQELTKALADALASLAPHVDEDADYHSVLGLVRRAVNHLSQAAGQHADDCAAQARRKPVNGGVPGSLTVAIKACKAEQQRRAQGKAAKLADLQSQLAALGVRL